MNNTLQRCRNVFENTKSRFDGHNFKNTFLLNTIFKYYIDKI